MRMRAQLMIYSRLYLISYELFIFLKAGSWIFSVLKGTVILGLFGQV